MAVISARKSLSGYSCHLLHSEVSQPIIYRSRRGFFPNGPAPCGPPSEEGVTRSHPVQARAQAAKRLFQGPKMAGAMGPLLGDPNPTTSPCWQKVFMTSGTTVIPKPDKAEERDCRLQPTCDDI